MLGVADGFSASAVLVFEGAVEVVTDSVTSAEVVESSVEVLVCWSRAEVELPVATEDTAREVSFAAPEADAEPSDAAESDRFHCGKESLASVFS